MEPTTTQLRMMMKLSPFPEVREVFAASIRRRRLEEARRSKITVHPFVRSDGEDRTKHTTTLAAAIEEMIEDDRLRSSERANRIAGAWLRESMRLRSSVTRRTGRKWDAFASAVVMYDAPERQR